MSILDRYLAYADAFEETYVDDDWSRVGAFFHDDAATTDNSGAEVVGRDAVMASLKGSVDAFDRKFDQRIPDFQPPSVEGDRITMRWTVTYQKAGVPDLVIYGVEHVDFEGDRIKRLGGQFDPDAQKAMGEWMAQHGGAL